jgi:hypothetical protein
MDNVTDARMRWLESSLDLVRTAFADGATEEHRKAAATILRAAASILDGTPEETEARNAPNGAGAQATSAPGHPVEQFLAALVAKLEEREEAQQQQQRNGTVATPYAGYPAAWWPWAWTSWR